MKERAIVLIDGEHHPGVVRDGLSQLAGEHEIAAVVFAGGTEKVAPAVLADSERHYGFELRFGTDPLSALRSAIADCEADVVVDFSDEPTVPPPLKIELAELALANRISYQSPGLQMTPPILADVPFSGPTVSIVGTGKRCGKTAVCGHMATLLREAGHAPAVVSMGRGGPAEPAVAEPATALPELLEIASSGRHAASDYLEDAVLAGVPTVGCRRLGGGPGGQTGPTNFGAGALIAAGIEGIDCLLFEGSGMTIPPVKADRTICVVGSREQAQRRFGSVPIGYGDLLLVLDDQSLAAELAADSPGREVVNFALSPRPAVEIPDSAQIAYFTTGPSNLDGYEPVLTSRNLARRAELAVDLAAANELGCTHYLTELKAAAVDTVAVAAVAARAETVFVRNVPVAGDADLDAILLNLVSSSEGIGV